MRQGISNTAAVAATAASLAGATLGGREALGGLMNPNTPESSYLNYGNQFQGRVGFWQWSLPGSTNPGFASVTFINEWTAITAGHTVPSNASGFQVGTGSNYLTNRGSVANVANILFYPGWDGTRNTPDVAILQFATPLTGVINAEFGTAAPGQIVRSGGYGFRLYPNAQPPYVRDGARMGWDAPVETFAPVDSSNVFYNSTRFAAGMPGVPLVGKGLGGDSGGGVFNQNWELVGWNTAQSGNLGTSGTTIYGDLTVPDVRSWVIANTIPSPGFAGLVFAAAPYVARRRR